jgi:outer membrane protein assembly factor BamB
MTTLNQWVVSSRNKGRARWVSCIGGMPNKKPKWQLLKCAKYGAGWEFCATSNHVYINSADLLAVGVDIENGEKKWQTNFPDEATSSIAINSSQVCVPPYVLSQESGEIIKDLSELQHSYRIVEDVENEAFFITIDGDEKGVLRYLDGECDYIDIDIYGVSVTNDGEALIGCDNESLFAYSLKEGKKMWSLASPVGADGAPNSDAMDYVIINNTIYQHMYLDSLRCVNPVDGSIVWKSGPQHIDDVEPNQYRASPGKFLGCDDALYLCLEIEDNGFIQARSSTNGNLMWRADTPQARAFLIAGDLLFGALSDLPVAWDRYTGEVVWKADKSMTAIFHAVAASNKIIYTNTMSQMRCYEWTEPYHSPAKA